MSIARLTIAVIVGILGLAAGRPAGAQTYYLWKDANGNIAMSDNVPRGVTHYSTYRGPSTTTRNVPAASLPAADDDSSGAYDTYIERYAAANGIRSSLVRAVIQVESGFNSRATSPKGAMGLMQLMPATALDYGVANPYDPESNIRGGVRYLRTLLDRFNNNETLALAAYNAGPEAVGKYGNAVPPYRETQQYVGRVQSISPSMHAMPAPAPSAGGSVLAEAARAARANGTAVSPVRTVVPEGRRTFYVTVEVGPDGTAVPRYSDAKPPSGSYRTLPERR